MNTESENVLSSYLVENAILIKQTLKIGNIFFDYLANQIGNIDKATLEQYFYKTSTKSGSHYRLPPVYFEYFVDSLVNAVDKYFEDALNGEIKVGGRHKIDKHVSNAEDLQTRYNTWYYIKKSCIPVIQAAANVGFMSPIWKQLFPEDSRDPEIAAKDLPPSFSYRLCKNIDAYCTLNEDDLFFLEVLQLANEEQRADISKKLGSYAARPLLDIMKFHFSKEFKLWEKARSNCLSPRGESSSYKDNWKEFIGKLRKKTDKEAVALFYFLIATYNQRFNIGADEIDLLLAFKFGLTEKGKKDFIKDNL